MSVGLTGQGRRYRLARIEAEPGAALSLLDLPAGASLSDGMHRANILRDGMSVDVSRWQLDRIELALPADGDVPSGLSLLVLPRGGTKAMQRLCALSPLAVVAPQAAQAAICLSGLPAGSRISDGMHTAFSTDVSQPHDIYGWRLDRLTLRPPKGWHGEFRLRVRHRGLAAEALAALGALQIRLLSANAYLTELEEELARHSLPLMDIVVEGLVPETQQALSVRSQRVLGREADDTPLDDDALAALERKFRLN